MSPIIKNRSFFVFLSILVIFYWQKIISIESESEQFYLLFISLTAFTSSIILSKKFVLNSSQKQILNALIGILSLAILLIAWNSIFRWYSDTHDFRGNIFRGILYGFRAPFYGRLNPKIILSNYYPAIFTATLFILFILYFHKKINAHWQRPVLFLFAVLLFFSFAWNHTLHRTFLAINCHYSTFSEGLSFFPEWATFLSSYTDQMHLLGAHNNHYPPGNLLLLKLNNDSLPYLFKSLVILAPVISLFPIIGILKQIEINDRAIDRYIAFYISSIPLLFYPATSLTPILLIFASSGLYFLIKANRSNMLKNAVLSGLFFAIYAFFSFSFILFAFFAGVICLLFLKYQFVKKKTLLYTFLAAIGTFILIYTIIYLVFDFNLYTCLNTAIHNENLQMKSSLFDDLWRYLIVSTGNLFAYIGIFGPVIIAFFTLFIRLEKKPGNKKLQLFIQSVLITILILAFSNQFFLEIERIWIFLSPFMLFIVIPNYFDEKKNVFPTRILIASNMIVSLLYLISMNNCT